MLRILQFLTHRMPSPRVWYRRYDPSPDPTLVNLVQSRSIIIQSDFNIVFLEAKGEGGGFVAASACLVLICRRSTCDMAAGTAYDTTPTYEDITPPETRNITGLQRWHAYEVELESTSQAGWR